MSRKYLTAITFLRLDFVRFECCGQIAIGLRGCLAINKVMIRDHTTTHCTNQGVVHNRLDILLRVSRSHQLPRLQLVTSVHAGDRWPGQD